MTAAESILTMPDYCTISTPCGHVVGFEAACVRTDEFICPVCKHWWQVHQAPPEKMPSGMWYPGKRTIVYPFDNIEFNATSQNSSPDNKHERKNQ